ncbi:MAG: DUF1501 domain-containing protein, partial [Verrucomicrobiota bacterium]|nr:DUF1501 domain-containing protein [Verrucomicrobiota bacterium]
LKELEGKIAAYMKEHADDLASWEKGLTPEIKKSLSAGIVKIVAVPAAKRTFAQKRALFAGGIGGVGPFRELNDRYTELDTILIDAFTMWFAGGGFKPGTVYGTTDDFGFGAAENPVHVHNIHATLLHQLGLDHERLTVKSQGLDFRLTGVEPAKVVKGLLA